MSTFNWLGLAIGNSRSHWAWFVGATIQETWDTDHLSTNYTGGWPAEILLPSRLDPNLIEFIYLASVVPSQTKFWETHPNVCVITLEHLPLQGVYPTLGIDRALAVLGAGITWGWPVLVIDAGTALTLTGADATRQLIGGAILPGLGLQLQSLAQKTAQLPTVNLPSQLPPRFALNTQDAINSGVIYTIVAGIRDFIQAWWEKFPDSRIILTGGDRTFLFTYLQTLFPEVASQVTLDPNLIFLGMRAITDLRFEISNLIFPSAKF